jgi:hypothetical protein
MESVTLSKNQLISILKKTQTIVYKYRSKEVGADIFLGIGDWLIDLDCCIKNLVQYKHVQRQIACLLEDSYNILSRQEYDDIEIYIGALQKSISELEGLSRMEVMGDNCLQEYVKLGFDGQKYNREYLIMNTTILNKQQLIEILEAIRESIQPYQYEDSGINILLEIEHVLSDLICCIKNIVQFTNLQRHIACLLEDCYNLLDKATFAELKLTIASLRVSSRELDIIARKEIGGKPCLEDYINFGFEGGRYNSKYTRATEYLSN